MTFARKESRYFYLLLAAGMLVALLGLAAAHYMETHGHVVTGMTNQVVWGIPHVFAIFMIVAASGVLNVASIGSVFGKTMYKARAPLSSLLSIALLAGGLSVLVLDLGHPDRVVLAAFNLNTSSIFAWNILLYNGLFVLAALYLWTMLEQRMNRWYKPVGFTVFGWRVVLTSCTGLIFAFLIARPAYGTALLAPMFIVMSFAWGLAVFHVVQSAMFAWNQKTLDADILNRLKNLLGVFVLATLYLVAIYHLTNLYFAKNVAFEHFILRDGGVYPWLFWGGYVVLGSLLPLLLIYAPGRGKTKCVVAASLLVILGSLALLYVFIIGGQAFPLSIFPGYEAHSSFGDGEIGRYAPSLPEFLLGIGGLAIAFIITTIGVRVVDSLPRDLPQPQRQLEDH